MKTQTVIAALQTHKPISNIIEIHLKRDGLIGETKVETNKPSFIAAQNISELENKLKPLLHKKQTKTNLILLPSLDSSGKSLGNLKETLKEWQKSLQNRLNFFVGVCSAMVDDTRLNYELNSVGGNVATIDKTDHDWSNKALEFVKGCLDKFKELSQNQASTDADDELLNPEWTRL